MSSGHVEARAGDAGGFPAGAPLLTLGAVDSGARLRHRQAAPSELVALARQHLSQEHAVYFAPGIPPDKEANARYIHEAHLPASEPILVLYDATVFGGAENGFVITPERFCWKNLLEHPRQVPWGELDPRSVVAEADRVRVAGGGVQVGGEMIAGVVALLVALVERYVRPDAGPYRTGVSPDAGDDGELRISRITVLSRRHVGELEQMYYHPAIPPVKLRNARAEHAGRLDAGEAVAVLYDDTMFGSARDGFLITPRRLCWKNVVSAATTVEWRHVAPETVIASGNLVHLEGWTLQLTARPDLAAPVAALFAAIAAEARGDRRS